MIIYNKSKSRRQAIREIAAKKATNRIKLEANIVSRQNKLYLGIFIASILLNVYLLLG